MKKYLTLIITIISVVIFFFLQQNVSKEESNILPAQSKTNDEIAFNKKIVNYEDYLYSYDFILVNNVDKISLVPNYEQKMSSDEILQANSCEYLSSAGFYSKDDEPIGLLVSDYKIINNSETNQLFNGFLTINSFDTPLITPIELKEGARISVQSGPVLIINSFTQILGIKNDKEARRVVAAVTGSNELILIVIYDKESVFNGPKLSNLPKIIELIDQDNNFNIADAINLDGGSASTFYKDGFMLKELTSVGSFFCVK